MTSPVARMETKCAFFDCDTNVLGSIAGVKPSLPCRRVYVNWSNRLLLNLKKFKSCTWIELTFSHGAGWSSDSQLGSGFAVVASGAVVILAKQFSVHHGSAGC